MDRLVGCELGGKGSFYISQQVDFDSREPSNAWRVRIDDTLEKRPCSLFFALPGTHNSTLAVRIRGLPRSLYHLPFLEFANACKDNAFESHSCRSPYTPDVVCGVNRCRCSSQPKSNSAKDSKKVDPNLKTEKAILAGGCFWGMEDLFRKQPGVVSTRCGYTGGDVKNATYRNHGTHAEAIEVIYDPSKTDYRKMLEFFFQIHDPTTKNRQGNDIGMSYRSAIYYVSEEQKRLHSIRLKMSMRQDSGQVRS